MAYKPLFLVIAAMFLLVSCTQANDVNTNYYSQVVKIGKSANLKDLSAVVEKWHEVKSAIISYESRSCVRDNLTLEKLKFFDIEPLKRLSISATGTQHEIDPKDVKKIFTLSFSDPCGETQDYSTNPEWVIVETVNGFEVIDFVQIME